MNSIILSFFLNTFRRIIGTLYVVEWSLKVLSFRCCLLSQFNLIADSLGRSQVHVHLRTIIKNKTNK